VTLTLLWQVLLYNLIEWWGGRLPWDRELLTPDLTKVGHHQWRSPSE
jgi:hypothetical protein